MKQQTLKQNIEIKGIGLHSGKQVTMHLKPMESGYGIVFERVDLPKETNRIIPALWNCVVDTQLCTVIANESGASVGTVEHFMAALRGVGIDNLHIEIDGSEVPVMDGSSGPFVEKLLEAGTVKQDEARLAIRVLKSVSVTEGDKILTLEPADVQSFEGSIEFPHPVIGEQRYGIQMVNGNFCHDLADARTFGFLKDVEYMRKNGLALGGSLDNAIVLDQDKVLNTKGLRFDNEFIRHKLLDAIGDLYLAGHVILGRYEGHKSSHSLNNQLLHALFASEENWDIVSLNSASGQATPSYTPHDDEHNQAHSA